jgi:hypothetical protein
MASCRVSESTVQLDFNIAGHQIVGVNAQIPSFSPICGASPTSRRSRFATGRGSRS